MAVITVLMRFTSNLGRTAPVVGGVPMCAIANLHVLHITALQRLGQRHVRAGWQLRRQSRSQVFVSISEFCCGPIRLRAHGVDGCVTASSVCAPSPGRAQLWPPTSPRPLPVAPELRRHAPPDPGRAGTPPEISRRQHAPETNSFNVIVPSGFDLAGRLSVISLAAPSSRSRSRSGGFGFDRP